MSKSLSFLIPETKDAISRIRKFIGPNESGVILTPDEERMLARMAFAHGHLAENKFAEDQVAEKIKDLFSVSIYTAKADIRNTYSLFVTVTEDYRRYGLKHHIEFLKKELHRCSNDKSLAFLIPKLADSITKAYKELPVQMDVPPTPQPIIVIDTDGKLQAPSKTYEETVAEIDKLIAIEEKKKDYIDFNEVKDE